MKTLMRLSAAVAILLMSLPALAGTQGRVTGRVTDSAGNPVEGVTVTITTPALKSFKLSSKTGADGKWATIVNDATIIYTVRFEKDGFVPAEQTNRKFSTVDITTVDQKLLKTSEAPRGAGGAPAAAAPSANEQGTIAYNTGVDLMNAGDRAGAKAKFLESVQKNPDFPQGWRALASFAHEDKDWAHVIEYGQKATDLDPSMTRLYGLMADAATKTGDKKAAEEYRKKYEDANPDTPEILYNKGVDAYNKKSWKEAEELLAKAAVAKPDFALAHYYAGLAAMNAKHNAAAKEHFQKYLELEPNGSEAGTVKELLPLVK
ncbi:MAG TPA: tetratricopeptide repeat protein [Thermoanaerobaculia bacterium]|nr:tetratricopeptide repeat protein [Thermoanaerobaculia bacterium]